MSRDHLEFGRLDHVTGLHKTRSSLLELTALRNGGKSHFILGFLDSIRLEQKGFSTASPRLSMQALSRQSPCILHFVAWGPSPGPSGVVRACELHRRLRLERRTHVAVVLAWKRNADLGFGSLLGTNPWSIISEAVGRQPAFCSAGGSSTTVGKPRASGKLGCPSEVPGAAILSLTGL